jgi:hypothetical protein
VPPFFVFRKASLGPGRAVEFLGVAVPGATDVSPLADLVAVWRTKAGRRFQAYKATFTVLDIASTPRAWIEQLTAGEPLGNACPPPFRRWIEDGKCTPLQAPRVVEFRTPADQRPQTPQDAALVRAIYEHFAPDPYRFEACAIELWKMTAREAVTVTATRRSRDSGRDAYGTLALGPAGDRIQLDFSLEAKCYRPDRGCGTRHVAADLPAAPPAVRRLCRNLVRWAGPIPRDTRGRPPAHHPRRSRHRRAAKAARDGNRAGGAPVAARELPDGLSRRSPR